MGFILFLGSVVLLLLSFGAYREGLRVEAGAVFVASAILFSSAAIVSAIRAIRDGMAKRFPLTPTERMVASYRKDGGD